MAGLIVIVSAADSTPAVGLLRNNGLNGTVVRGDFNNDGKLDAILGDADADGLGAFVYVVPGKGDLSFDFQAGVALKPGHLLSMRSPPI
jgi:hypothetical protein